jgi:hypothetical protein
MTSNRAALVGSVLALGVPLGYLVLGVLVQNRLAPYDQVHSLLNAFGTIGWLDLFVLGPAGIAMVVWSRGLRGATAVLTMLVSLPVFVVAWFIGVATLSGALGNPF